MNIVRVNRKAFEALGPKLQTAVREASATAEGRAAGSGGSTTPIPCRIASAR